MRGFALEFFSFGGLSPSYPKAELPSALIHFTSVLEIITGGAKCQRLSRLNFQITLDLSMFRGER